MKNKKLSMILAILFMFAILCGCNGNGNDPRESSTEQSIQNSISQDSSDLSDISSDDPDSSADSWSKPEPQPVDIGNGMTLTGTLLDASELEEFSIEPYTSRIVLETTEEDFFDSLEIPELKDVYKRAVSLYARLSTTEFNRTFAAEGNGRTPARIDITVDGKFAGEYIEWGYTYNSFYNSFLSTFTKETAEKIFKEYDFFLNFNGALLCELTSSGGSYLSGGAWEVHREYELISKSDTVIECRRNVFEFDRDFKPAEEWIPELRDEYIIDHVDFKFVLTEDGWRMSLDEVVKEVNLDFLV